jgi:predicted site-specific integrase-resolvase
MRNDADHWLDAIISLQEAAELRGINIKTLRSEIRRGALKDIRISKKRRGMTGARHCATQDVDQATARIGTMLDARPQSRARRWRRTHHAAPLVITNR